MSPTDRQNINTLDNDEHFEAAFLKHGIQDSTDTKLVPSPTCYLMR